MSSSWHSSCSLFHRAWIPMTHKRQRNITMRHRLRIFTWHVHGSYLYSLSQMHHEIFVPVKPGQPAGYTGRSSSFPWPDNLREVPAEEVRRLEFDCVLFQSAQHYLKD